MARRTHALERLRKGGARQRRVLPKILLDAADDVLPHVVFLRKAGAVKGWCRMRLLGALPVGESMGVGRRAARASVLSVTDALRRVGACGRGERARRGTIRTGNARPARRRLR